MKTKDLFVWYATDLKHGTLVMAVPSIDYYKNTYIYCPNMIRDRLGTRMNPLFNLELNLGPVGFIPRACYEEAGITVPTPFMIRMLAIIDRNRKKLGMPDDYMGKHDKSISSFILTEWKKVYNSD